MEERKCPSCGLGRSDGEDLSKDDGPSHYEFGLYVFTDKLQIDAVLSSQDKGFVNTAMLWAQTREPVAGSWYACVGNCGAVGQFALVAQPPQYGMDDNAYLHPWGCEDEDYSVSGSPAPELVNHDRFGNPKNKQIPDDILSVALADIGEELRPE